MSMTAHRKGKLHLSVRADGYGFLYGVWIVGAESIRVDIMPPKAHWQGDMLLATCPPHDTDWVIYADGKEIARVQAEDRFTLERSLRAGAPLQIAQQTTKANAAPSADTHAADKFGTAPEFILILLVMVWGMWGGSWLVVLPAGLALTLRSAVSAPYWWEQFRKRGLELSLALFWLGCLAQNCGFAAAALLAGHAVRWLWGVPW